MRAAVYWQNYVDSIVKSNIYNILDTELKYMKIKNSCILKIMLKTWNLQPKYHDNKLTVTFQGQCPP